MACNTLDYVAANPRDEGVNNMADCSAAKVRPATQYAQKRVICAAWGCNNYKGTNEKLSFFHFPRKLDQCKRWIYKLRRADLEKLDADQLRHRIVCQNHFDPSDISFTPKR